MANKYEVKNYNYITIQGWLRNNLNLSGNELIVYSIIYGFSQAKNQWCSATIGYLSEWTGASEKTIRRIINGLEDKGYIKKRKTTDETGWYCEYKAIVPEIQEEQSAIGCGQNDRRGMDNLTGGNGQNDHRGMVNLTGGNGQNDHRGMVNLSEYTIKDNIYNNIYNNNIEDKSSARAPKKAFVKPTVEEIAAYIQEKKYNINPEQFFNYYESNGWKVGRNPMKNWKSAVNTWAHNGFSNNSTRKSTSCGNNSPAGFDEMFE